MESQSYNSRSARRRPQAMTGLELFVTVATLVAVVALIVVFLVVYHDFPLRVA